MKKLLLFAAVVLTTHANAAHWVAIAGTDEFETSIDVSSIRLEPSGARFWVRRNSKVIVRSDMPASFHGSTAAMTHVNCQDGTMTISSQTVFSEQDLQGNALSSDNYHDWKNKFTDQIPGSEGESIVETMCITIKQLRDLQKSQSEKK